MGRSVNETVRGLNGELIRNEYSDFYHDMSQVESMNSFQQILEAKEDQEREKIEEGIIYLSTMPKDKLKDYEVIFQRKYHDYLIDILKKDVRKYYNDKYCKYLYFRIWRLIATNQLDPETKFINGKSMKDIDLSLASQYNKLIEDMQKGIDLKDEDKKFVEETFLAMVLHDIVYKEYAGEKDLMYDIVEFFTRYPIRDISTSRNRQLSLLSILASRMIKIPSNCGIVFDTDYEELGNNNICLGCFSKTPSGIPYIKINDLEGIYTERSYLERVFTVFHELGHFLQKYDEFNDEFNKVIEIERYLVKNDNSFYKMYHDSFCLEWDADNYAITQLIEVYGAQYSKLVTDIVERIINKRRIDWPTFYLMELEEYEKICHQEYHRSH